jgi:predicted phage tail protein
MRRKVILEGELGEKFGRSITISADTHQSILKCIDANRPGFRPYLLQCMDSGTGFVVDVAGKSVEKEEDLLIPLKEGDVTITAVPAGSKTGVGKILAAIALTTLILASAGAAVGAGMGMNTTFAAKVSLGMSSSATFSTLQLAGLSLSVNLALAGVQQLMAPDPAVDKESPTDYLYKGSSQNIIEGDPVPILYGELRVPGRMVGLDIIPGRYRNNNVIIDSNHNDLIVVEAEIEEE